VRARGAIHLPITRPEILDPGRKRGTILHRCSNSVQYTTARVEPGRQPRANSAPGAERVRVRWGIPVRRPNSPPHPPAPPARVPPPLPPEGRGEGRGQRAQPAAGLACQRPSQTRWGGRRLWLARRHRRGGRAGAAPRAQPRARRREGVDSLSRKEGRNRQRPG